VQDDKWFSSFAFLKNKLRATLDPHLPVVLGMYSQKNLDLKVFHMLPHSMLGLEQLIVTVFLHR
jgi:hypothetical protein